MVDEGATIQLRYLPLPTSAPSSLNFETLHFSISIQRLAMAMSVTAISVDNVTFPPTVNPSSSSSGSFFLGGAGVRGLQIQENFVKFTAIGIYLHLDALPYLSVKWKAKSVHDLAESPQFFTDIVTGPFEKFMQVTMIKPLTGQQYSEKVAENCEAIWKSLGIYTDSEAEALDKFLSVFKDQTFPPPSSILFTLLSQGSLAITFSQDGTIPKVANSIIDNKLLSEAVLESMIGKNGVSPSAKQSLASRLSHLFNPQCDHN